MCGKNQLYFDGRLGLMWRSCESDALNSIRIKLTVLVASLLLVALVSLSVASYFFTRRMLHRHIDERLTVIASERQKLVLGYIQQQMERGTLVASRKLLRDYLGDLANGKIPPEQLQIDTHQSLEDARQLTPGLQAIWIADLAGRVRIATDKAHVGRDVAGTREFMAGLIEPSFFLLPDSLHQDSAILSAPAMVGTNPVGVVFVLADQKPLRKLLRDRTGLGRTGEVMLGARAGDKIDYLLSPVADVPLAQAPAMAAALNGESGFKAVIDYRGDRVLAAYRPVGYRDWGIVTKIDEAEAYEPVNVLRHLFISIELAVFLVGIFTAYGLAHRFTRPISSLAGMADQIAAGRLSARVPIKSTDEVGHLSQAFNRMSEELAHSHAILEGTVAQRTQELRAERDLLQGLLDNTPDRIYFKNRQSQFTRSNLALAKFFGFAEPESLVGKTDFDLFSREHAQQAFDDEQRVIQTGQPVFNIEEKETWPDGRVTWSSTTKIPLRDAAGKIIGTFGISREITERKRAEELLAQYAGELSAKDHEIQEDLVLACEIHQTFIRQDYPCFPVSASAGQSALQFAHRYLPASTLGGDFFDIWPVSETEAGFLICDVMGHGIRAALVTSILRGLLDKYRTLAHDPSELLNQINQALLENLKSVSSTVFATACCGVLDATTGRLRMANAGHPAPLLIRSATRQVERLAGAKSAPALGILRDAVFTTLTTTLDVHDRLLLFTDGIYEVESAAGQEFGLDRLLATIQQRAAVTGGQLLDDLLTETRQYAATGEFTDDVCLVSVERVG